WCFGAESLNGPSDFYYGTLPRLLEERGVSCALLCGDARGDSERALAEAAFRRTSIRSVPEWLLIPLWASLATVWDQILTSLVLYRLAREERDPRLATLCAYASLDCLTPATTRNTLHFYIARAAVRAWDAKVFVTFYEGQPWEKLAWHGAKAASSDCLTVGYQHTVVMPHSLALLSPNRGSWELATPDVALCLGETTKRMMAPGHEPDGTKLLVFGSFRARPAGEAETAPRPGLQTILVVPETGVIREAKLLFDFATRAARLLPGYHFIFRCHPIMPFGRIRPHLEEMPEECPNIEVSTRETVSDDFAEASVLLYRGSSTVLYAVLYGLKALYLHDDDHPDVDPLFEMEAWREAVCSPAALAEVLARYRSEAPENATEDWRRAVDYVRAYTCSVSDGAIDRFLAAVGLPSGSVSP
ncbi:MAG TPA: hypothetical protein VJP78_15385, partial [Thermoleophilia bacterium]|nr:hypothetical protein [Thermoleophilia bacterium]